MKIRGKSAKIPCTETLLHRGNEWVQALLWAQMIRMNSRTCGSAYSRLR